MSVPDRVGGLARAPLRPGHRDAGEVHPATLRERVVAALRAIRDPELPVNIYDLGLIYGLDIDALGRVGIRMTLTAPGCPVAQGFPAEVEDAVEAVDGVSVAHVELVWDPPWDPSRLSEAARLELGLP
jgi:FeS assembly SUF system protein